MNIFCKTGGGESLGDRERGTLTERDTHTETKVGREGGRHERQRNKEGEKESDPEWEGGSRWGTLVHPWLIHVRYGKNHYNIVK